MHTDAADAPRKHAEPMSNPSSRNVEYALLKRVYALRRTSAKGSSVVPALTRMGYDVTKSAIEPQRGRCRVLGVIVLATALGIGWVAPLRADQITDDNVAEAVSAAKTASDHQALAAYFKAKAAAATAKAGMHQRMSAAFGGKGRESSQMHCKALVRTSKEQAKDYAALAKEQERLAEGK